MIFATATIGRAVVWLSTAAQEADPLLVAILLQGAMMLRLTTAEVALRITVSASTTAVGFYAAARHTDAASTKLTHRAARVFIAAAAVLDGIA